MKISSFCKQNYETTSIPTESLKNVNLFILPVTEHNSAQDFKTHAQFINQFGNESILFCPNVALFAEPSLPYIQPQPLTVKNVTVVGWDYIQSGDMYRQEPNRVEEVKNFLIKKLYPNENTAIREARITSAITAIEVADKVRKNEQKIIVVVPGHLLEARLSRCINELKGCVLHAKPKSRL